MELFTTLDTDDDGVISREEFVLGFAEYQEFTEDDMPLCVEAPSSVIKGVPNPYNKPCPEPEEQQESEEKEQEQEQEQEKKSKSSSSCSSSSDSSDCSDDDFPMCVESASSVIKGVANPHR